MSSQPSSRPKVLFDSFEFHPSSGELRKHGRVLRLQGQPLQILETLLEEPGQLVSREDLQRRLWNGAVSGDFEHGLNAAVNKLRQTLGDSAEDPRFIETIPGKGYRFLSSAVQATRPVLELKPAPPPPPSPQGTAARPATRPSIPDWAWGAAAGAVAAVLITFWATGYGIGGTRRPSSAPQGRLAQFLITPPAGYFLEGATSRQSIAVSPDGTRIAFAAMDASGLFRIFTRAIGEVESREVPGSNGAGSLFWLPDGSLVFAAQGKVRRHSPGTPASQILSETTPVFTSGILLPQDRMLLTSRFRSALLPANGGPLEHLKSNIAWPQLLPDGRHILQSEFDASLGLWRTRAARLGDPKSTPEILLAGSRAIYTESPASGQSYLLYASGGALLAQPFDPGKQRMAGAARVIVPRVYSFLPAGSADFSISARGELLVYQTVVQRSQLIWVDRTGRTLRAAGPDRILTKDARLSPDGAQFASARFDVERGATEIWVTGASTGHSRRQIAGPGLVTAPIWSPDSKRLAFLRALESVPKLRIRSLDDPENEQTLASDGFQVPTDWTSDGRFILFTDTGLPLVENEGNGDIWAADLNSSGRQTPLIRTPFHEGGATASPDGRWVAFISNESGKPEVYLQRLESGSGVLKVAGPRHPVSKQGAVCLRWRRDGKELFYLANDSHLYAVAMGLGAPERPAIGIPQPLFQVSPAAIAAIHSLPGFDAAADGQSFVVPSVSSAEPSALVAIQHWEALLAAPR